MPKLAQRSVIVAYIPVLHRGYIQFFAASPSSKELYVIGPDLLKKIDYLRKDLRALAPNEVIEIISTANIFKFKSVSKLTAKEIRQLDNPNIQILMPDEDISHMIGAMFKHAKVEYFPIFLRWDRRSLERIAAKVPSEKTSNRKVDKDHMKEAYTAAGVSSDIWRRVGALLLTKDGKRVGLAVNQGEPNPHSPWMEGDPRNIFNQGVGIEMSVFMHAEAALIADAAKAGIRLKGATMYVTTFPCPACAKLVAHSGIKNLFYGEGYGVLDGQRILEVYGVQLRRVNVKAHDERPETWVPYKKNKG